MTNFSWKTFLTELRPGIKFGKPACEEKLMQIEKELGNNLPDQLKSLLGECGEVGIYPGDDVWRPEKISSMNLHYRNQFLKETPQYEYMPLDVLLFFGDDGTGCCFGFPVIGKHTGDSVFYWSTDDDSRTEYTKDLKTFFLYRYTGR